MDSLKLDNIILFAIFAFPGFVGIRFYSLLYPSKKEDWKDYIVDSIALSIFNFSLFLPLLIYLDDTAVLENLISDDKTSALKKLFNLKPKYYLYFFYYGIASPSMIVFFWSLFIRSTLAYKYLGFDYPTKTAWDFLFTKIEPCFIIFYLKDKEENKNSNIRIGYFGKHSYVSSYPIDADIYVEKVHYVTEDGGVGDPVPDTYGMHIKYSECLAIELLRDIDYQNPNSLFKSFLVFLRNQKNSYFLNKTSPAPSIIKK